MDITNAMCHSFGLCQCHPGVSGVPVLMALLPPGEGASSGPHFALLTSGGGVQCSDNQCFFTPFFPAILLPCGNRHSDPSWSQFYFD